MTKTEMIIKIMATTRKPFDWNTIEKAEKINIRAIWQNYYLLYRLGIIK